MMESKWPGGGGEFRRTSAAEFVPHNQIHQIGRGKVQVGGVLNRQNVLAWRGGEFALSEASLDFFWFCPILIRSIYGIKQ